MTGPSGLRRWQWEGYPKYHRQRTNLVLHVLTAPFFWAGTLLLLAGLATLNWIPLAGGATCIVMTLVVQGWGHKLEPTPAVPFTGPWNFMARLFLEQWINFPRYVLTGGWWRAWRGDAG